MEDTKRKKPKPGELDSVEVEASTPTEAIRKALTILKASRKEVKVRILSEERKGLFGMAGNQQAKVKVTIIKSRKNIES